MTGSDSHGRRDENGRFRTFLLVSVCALARSRVGINPFSVAT